jgi:hypothetical protein
MATSNASAAVSKEWRRGSAMNKLRRVRAFASMALVAVAIVLAASAPSQAQRGGGGHSFFFGDPYYGVYPPPDGYAAPEYWYYCPSYGDYYPNVQSCPDPWVPEPAS